MTRLLVATWKVIILSQKGYFLGKRKVLSCLR